MVMTFPSTLSLLKLTHSRQPRWGTRRFSYVFYWKATSNFSKEATFLKSAFQLPTTVLLDSYEEALFSVALLMVSIDK